MAITYDHTANVITATVGPYGFVDLWNADKAGTLENVHARNIAAADGAPVAVSHALRPTDMNVLGLADIFITVTNYVGGPNTIQLVGTEEYGAAQTENIVVAANGVYNSTLYWKTIASTQVTVYGGTFTYTLSQGQWGVVWLQGTQQFRFTAQIVIGDAVNATTFLDSNKQVVFYGAGSAGGLNWFDCKNLATVTLGILINAATYATDSGIAFLFAFASNYAYINADTGAVCDFYSCSISGVGCISRIKGNGIRRIWNFIGNRFRIGQISNVNANFFNLYIAPPNAEYCLISPLTATINTIIVRGTPSYIAYFAAGCTVTNLDASGATTKSFDMGGAASMYLINSILDAWTFNWAALSTSILYRQYTFDLRVTDQDDNPLANATVALRNNAGALIFSVLTNAAGDIIQQTVTRGYYNLANGSVLQDYSPHALTITRAGYQTYHKHFTLTAKTTWEIKLARISQILLDRGNPVLNIVPTDPENKQILTF